MYKTFKLNQNKACGNKSNKLLKIALDIVEIYHRLEYFIWLRQYGNQCTPRPEEPPYI